MGRQRTINDQNFWHAPRLEGCTSEDKFALIHLLTGPKSNITGVYTLVPRHAGAELGWTQEQWRDVVNRLQERALARYDDERLMVWVRVWWEHHNARQTMGVKLRGRAVEEINRIPASWLDEFLTDYRSRLMEEQRHWLSAVLTGLVDTSAEGYGYGIDTSAGKVRHNTNKQQKLLTETTTGNSYPQSVDMSGIPVEFQGEVYRAIQVAIQEGLIRHDPQLVIKAMVERYRSPSPPRSAYPLTLHLAKHLQPGASVGGGRYVGD